MSSTIVVVQAGGKERYRADELPLHLGGADGDIRIPGYFGEQPLAILELEEGDLFVQPVDGSGVVICNGSPVSASQWLRSGDILRLGQSEISVSQRESNFSLEIVHRAPEQKTDPPLVQARPRPDRVADQEIDTRVSPVEFTPASNDRTRARRKKPSR